MLKKYFLLNSETNNWRLTTDFFICDGWDLIAEPEVGRGVPAAPIASTYYYVWSLDLSGSLQGAGRIGGFLSAVFGGTSPPRPSSMPMMPTGTYRTS
jgi:hypothetical protein